MQELGIIRKCTEKATGLDITKRTRKNGTVMARWIYYRLAREFTKYSLSAVTNYLGYDHATMVHGLKRFEIDILKDTHWLSAYIHAKELCEGILGKHGEIDDETTIAMQLEKLKISNLRLKEENQFLKHAIRGSVNLSDPGTLRMFQLFEKLGEDERENAILKVRTMVEVRKRLNDRKPIRANNI